VAASPSGIIDIDQFQRFVNFLLAMERCPFEPKVGTTSKTNFPKMKLFQLKYIIYKKWQFTDPQIRIMLIWRGSNA